MAVLGIFMYFGSNIVASSHETDAAGGGEPQISKLQAAKAALDFAKQRFAIAEADTFVTYQTHKLRSAYLERKGLASEYAKKFGADYPLDYFTVEVKSRSGSPTHLFIDVNYSTKAILGWKLSAGNARGADAKLDRPRYEEAARAELKQHGLNPDEFQLVADDSAPDNRFTFVDKSTVIGEAKLQVQIDIAAGRTIGYEAAFILPSEHLDWMERQDRAASIMTWCSLGLMFVMAAAGLVFAVIYRSHVLFGRGIVLSLLYALFYCINNINMLPAIKAEQGADVTGFGTIATVVFVNFVTLLMAVGVYVSFVSGIELWRRTGWNPWPRWRESAFGADVFAAMGRGYLLCLFILGVQRILFLGGEQIFGVWAVSDASSSPYNMFAPALFPLLAWCAGISEEATFRLFGIAFFQRIVRIRFLAVLIPSVIWAASHTQYPIYPVYTRLVEVTVLGVIFGYAFLKYGFMTALFTHATMDSLLMGLDLVTSHSGTNIALGVFYMLSPLLVGWLLAWIHGRWRRSAGAAAQ
jgi:hypothetical protein